MDRIQNILYPSDNFLPASDFPYKRNRACDQQTMLLHFIKTDLILKLI